MLDDLQAAARPHGLRFGPDLHPQPLHLGGMLGNNACGSRALAYGRTADNLLELDVVYGTGRRLVARPGAAGEVPGLEAVVGPAWPRSGPSSAASAARAPATRSSTCCPSAAATWPGLWSAARAPWPWSCRPRSGSSGRRRRPRWSCSATRTWEPRPTPSASSCRTGRWLLRGSTPASSRWSGAGGGRCPTSRGGGWLLVELAGATPGEAEAAAARLTTAVAGDALAARVLRAPAEAAAIWRIREDGAGFGGRSPAGAPSWAGWEDAAVPPERLGVYLRDFEALLADHGLGGIPYGHFGDGCLHVRIDFPFDRPGGQAVYRSFVEQAARLVARCGGSMSGEHGDGRARSEVLPLMYSPEAIAAMAAVKAVLDPRPAQPRGAGAPAPVRRRPPPDHGPAGHRAARVPLPGGRRRPDQRRPPLHRDRALRGRQHRRGRGDVPVLAGDQGREGHHSGPQPGPPGGGQRHPGSGPVLTRGPRGP